jgi:hypothetical protein
MYKIIKKTINLFLTFDYFTLFEIKVRSLWRKFLKVVSILIEDDLYGLSYLEVE